MRGSMIAREIEEELKREKQKKKALKRLKEMLKKEKVGEVNEKNLIPFTSEQSREEAKKNGAKGGQKSGESRRNRKLLKEYMETLLDMPTQNPKQIKTMSKMGIDGEEMSNKMALTVALFIKATSGDVNAIKEIRNLIGEEEAISNDEVVNIIDDV